MDDFALGNRSFRSGCYWSVVIDVQIFNDQFKIVSRNEHILFKNISGSKKSPTKSKAKVCKWRRFLDLLLRNLLFCIFQKEFSDLHSLLSLTLINPKLSNVTLVYKSYLFNQSSWVNRKKHRSKYQKLVLIET